MKRNLFYLFGLIFSMSLFTACSGDDKDGSSVVGTWNLAPTVLDNGHLVTGPLAMTWKAAEGTMVGSFPVASLAIMVEPLAGIVLPQVLKDVTFDEGNDILATYSDAGISLDGNVTPNWLVSEKGYARFEVVSDTKILVFLNLDKITSTKVGLDGIDDLLKRGIPVNVEWAADKKSMMCYIDKTLMTQMSGILAAIVAELPDGVLGEMEETLKPIILGLPAAMAATTEFKLGLKFNK